MIRNLIFLIFFPIVILSQKIYHFDYLLEYENVYFFVKSKKIENPSKFNNYWLVNSKTDGYVSAFEMKNDSIGKIIFYGKNGVYAHINFPIDSFNLAENILVNCEATQYNVNFYKRSHKRKFIQKTDTIVGGKILQHYMLVNKKKRNKSISMLHFLINEKESFHSNITLFPYELKGVENWTGNPVGLLEEFFGCNSRGDLIFKRKLKSVSKINKNLVMPENCN